MGGTGACCFEQENAGIQSLVLLFQRHLVSLKTDLKKAKDINVE